MNSGAELHVALSIAALEETQVSIELGFDVIFPIDKNWLKNVKQPLTLKGGEKRNIYADGNQRKTFSFEG